MDIDKKVEKLDKLNVLASIDLMPEQCQQAWDEVGRLKIKPAGQVENVVVAGMGGSSIGSHMFVSLFGNKLLTPFMIVNDYNLPEFVGEKSLVLLSSYSGNTEEVLSCACDALKRKAKIIGITSGGKLKNFLKKYDFPGYIFKPEKNPCNQPRIGLGYSVFGQIALFNKLGLISICQTEVKKLLDFLTGFKTNLKEKAKKTTERMEAKIVVLVAADFLSGNAHILANQINENAKTFAIYFLIPELNHHLMEGLAFPKTNNTNLRFIMLNSGFYSPIIQKRLRLTCEVIKKNEIATEVINLAGATKLSQAMEALLLGSYISFYLGILNNVNPAKIPWVEYFKKKIEN